MTTRIPTTAHHRTVLTLSMCAVLFLLSVYTTHDRMTAQAFFYNTDAEKDTSRQCTLDTFAETYLEENPHRERFIMCVGFFE